MTGPLARRTPGAGVPWQETLLRYGFPVAKRALFALDAEVAHHETVRLVSLLHRVPTLGRLTSALVGESGGPVEFAGVQFPGPMGLAAGMDKFGTSAPAWARLGFSHVELGTVTAIAQPGNEKPRLWRLPTSRAVINRMGFNNPGAAALAATLERYGIRRGNGAAGLVTGVSIGKSKVTPLADAVADYLTSFRAVAPHADYIAINVSSPNTPGLRSLQDKGFLSELTTALVAETRSVDATDPVPVLVKLAPDLTRDAVSEAVQVCEEAGIRGLIATNTTVERHGIAAIDRHLAGEAGGLSGAPLTRRSRAFVADLVAMTSLPVIGVGGIMTPSDASAMLDVGARLVQVCTGLIYSGPALVAGTNRMHRARADRAGES